MIERILHRIDRDREAAVERLADLLRIRSVSTDPAFATDCTAAAEWVAERLGECGLAVELHPTAGHPIVVARYDDAPAGAPRALFYGHYDVQPPDPVEKWTTPPFVPTVRDGAIYARGASDDKGQVMCFIEALRAYAGEAGRPPINLTVLIEGEEECGSPNLGPFIERYADDLRADVALISDTAMWGPGEPAITYALRGLLYFDVQLHGPSRDLHSGVYGGSIANPATELALVLGRLFDERHRVTIEGFYDDVIEPDAEERARWAELGFDEQQWARSVGMDAPHGEAGFTTLERRWARPSCDVNGLYGGYMGAGAKTVIPSFAGAKVSFRLAADQDPEKIGEAFVRWLDERTPPGCRWKIEPHGAAPPVSVATDSPWLAAARDAVRLAAGRPPVLIRDGATIPAVATLKSRLGLDSLLIGFGLHDDNLHSPNEKFDLGNFRLGARTHAALLHQLAARPSDTGRARSPSARG